MPSPDATLAVAQRPVASARLLALWKVTGARLLSLGAVSQGNQLTLFADGDDVYDAMVGAIGRASQRVWLETYIFEPDRVGALLSAALRAAKQRGVDVIVLVDAVGSAALVSSPMFKQLRDAQVDVVVFNPMWAWRHLRPVLQRDHRKILIVDDVAFCGGMNMSEDYAGQRHGNGRFKDTHALLEGPAAADAARIFASSLYAASKRHVVVPSATAPMPSGVAVQLLQSDVPRKKRHIQRALYQTVGRSQLRCFLTTPYFVPPPRLVRALVAARRRGVDVRVLTAGLSDVPMVAMAARHLYGRLLNAGVRVFEMTARTLHQKSATIDGQHTTIGSFNLDRWSFERNLEVTFSTTSADVARHLEAVFAQDIVAATEVTRATWSTRTRWQRVMGWLAYRLLCL